MSAMQKTSVPKDDEQKVPKLKLKLTQPFQKQVESEQSSTESDSDSDNEDDNNTSQDQSCNLVNSINTNDSSQQQQPCEEQLQLQSFSNYDTNNTIPDTSNNVINNSEENLNESSSSGKNTSTDSDDKSIDIDDNVQLTESFTATAPLSVPQNEPNDQSQLETQPIESNDQTANFIRDINNVTNVGVSCFLFAECTFLPFPSKFEPKQN